jgi:glycine betaine/choline ABC-type transport system substrate-binding protein
VTRAGSRLRGIAGLFAFVLATFAIFKLIFFMMDLRAGKGKLQITIGSKADTEGILLAEIIARRIERATDLTVTRRTALGGTQLCFQALLSGEVDLYPEYTGTALVALLERPALNDSRQTFDLVQRELLRRDELVMFEPFAFNNTYALAIAKPRAAALGVRKVSDLARHRDLTAGFTAEFMARQDGWPGLRERYELEFRSPPRTLEAGLMYRAAQQSEVDVISAYATDGRIEKFELLVLEDDKKFFPPYQAAPLIRQSTLAKHPALAPALKPLAGRLTDDEMRRLNAAVDIDRQRPEDVAEKYVSALEAEQR